MDIFKKALLNTGPPESFALQTVKEAIKSQRQTNLLLDEKQLLANILRTLLQKLVSCAVQSGEPIMVYGRSIADGVSSQGQIPRLFDMLLYLCEKEHVEGGMIFQLFEDLMEMCHIKDCKDAFAYIESKQDILEKQELFARGKVVMLRTCSQLLRRLSKANDDMFCGRILMFLTHFFPLSELSGISIDFNFYRTFWSLQECFYDPPSLTHSPTGWHKLMSSLMVVLNTLDAQPLSDEEGNSNNLEEEGAAFHIKYLINSKLMGLELKDISFRRHVLVQCLMLFDYLKAPGNSDKDMPSEARKEEMKSCEDWVKKLLELTPPKGKEFLASVEHILECEKNWVWWKRDGCPSFKRSSVETKVDVAKKRPLWLIDGKRFAAKIKKGYETYNLGEDRFAFSPAISCPHCHHSINNNDVGLVFPGLPKGVKFDPSDEEIIHHLLSKSGAVEEEAHPFIDEFIPTLEKEEGICYTHPQNIPGVKQDGSPSHFFHRQIKAFNKGTRKRRKIQVGNSVEFRWHKTGRTKPIILNGVHKGWRKILVLYENLTGGKSEKTSWVMHQYHLGSVTEEEKDAEMVVSKLYFQWQLMKQTDDKFEHPMTHQTLIPELAQNEDHEHRNPKYNFLIKDYHAENIVQMTCNENDEHVNLNETLYDGGSQFILDSQKQAEGPFDIFQSHSDELKDLEERHHLVVHDSADTELYVSSDFSLSQLEFGSQDIALNWGVSEVGD